MHAPRKDHRLYAYFVWSTVAGLPLIRGERRSVTESHLIQLCRAVGVEPVEVCVLPDRAHLLVRFLPGQSLTEIARRLQRRSEEVASSAGQVVRWSCRYGVMTVSPGAVRDLRRRIAWQAWEPIRSTPLTRTGS
ncbi:MAG: transposase [Gemmatimonadota bacterium]